MPQQFNDNNFSLLNNVWLISQFLISTRRKKVKKKKNNKTRQKIIPIFTIFGYPRLKSLAEKTKKSLNEPVQNQNSPLLDTWNGVIENSPRLRLDFPHRQLAREINEDRFNFTFKEPKVTLGPLKRGTIRTSLFLSFTRREYDSSKFLSSYPVSPPNFLNYSPPRSYLSTPTSTPKHRVTFRWSVILYTFRIIYMSTVIYSQINLK